ncbi:MAG: hypothetical protein JSV17_16295 [Candidatus Aminicenantes bacterium]|nr:MAG: hypothetical protein JSV17_16295 [Candidatus Aminicenantes bacterium]
MINILTGPVHSGKTTLLKTIIPVLRGKNIRIDGYLSEAVWKDEKFLGYDLLDLKDQHQQPFIRKKGQQGWQRIGPFYFLPGMLDVAEKIIHRSKNENLCVVDEVGPLELKGNGVWQALEEILMIPEQGVLLVVRESILKDFLEKIQRDDFKVYDIGQEIQPIRMVESLMQNLEKRRQSEAK